MEMPDNSVSSETLRQHGYYRLSGYSRFYRSEPQHTQGPTQSPFLPDVSIRDVETLEAFDAGLREQLFRGLARIEVALRSYIGHRLGRGDAFAHRQPDCLDRDFVRWRSPAAGPPARSPHAEWLLEYGSQEARAQEAFVDHFRSKYGRHLPVWVATEVMTLGTLTRLFNGMSLLDRQLIAARFRVLDNSGNGDAATLSNWLNHLRYVRNVCAHHGRVWNRTYDITLATPSAVGVPLLAHITGRQSRTVYGTLAVLRFLLKTVDSLGSWSQETTSYLQTNRPTRVKPVQMSDLGFPTGWRELELWQWQFQLDTGVLRTVDALDEVATFSSEEVLELFRWKGQTSKRKSWLRYLERKNALIVLQLGQAKRFPTFQFRDNNIDPRVADANEVLLNAARNTAVGADPRLNALAWWQTGHPHAPGGCAPVTLLASGTSADELKELASHACAGPSAEQPDLETESDCRI